MLLTMLEFRKINKSVCVTNYLGISMKEQMYYASLMISQVCEYEIPKISRDKNDVPIIRLALDEEKEELNIFSSEEEKETIEILSSSILLNLMSV